MTVVPAAIDEPVVQVRSGAVIDQVQLALFVAISEDEIPLKEKVVAEGDATLTPVPSKEITIFPPLGTALTVVKRILCIEVTGVVTTYVPDDSVLGLLVK